MLIDEFAIVHMRPCGPRARARERERERERDEWKRCLTSREAGGEDIFFNKHHMDLNGENFIHKKNCWDIYTSLPSWEDHKQYWMEAESHAYSYAYNDGHSDSRKGDEYRPNLSGSRQEADFKKILKQKAEYSRDSDGRFSSKSAISLTTAAIIGLAGAYLWRGKK